MGAVTELLGYQIPIDRLDRQVLRADHKIWRRKHGDGHGYQIGGECRHIVLPSSQESTMSSEREQGKSGPKQILFIESCETDRPQDGGLRALSGLSVVDHCGHVLGFVNCYHEHLPSKSANLSEG